MKQSDRYSAVVICACMLYGTLSGHYLGESTLYDVRRELANGW